MKTNRDWVTRVFQGFRQVACFYFKFLVAPGDIFFTMVAVLIALGSVLWHLIENRSNWPTLSYTR